MSAVEEEILRLLQESGAVTVDSVVQNVGISPATVRRHFHGLESRGLLRRTHGGARLVEPLLYDVFRHDSSFQEQIEHRAAEKRRIAQAAAQLIDEGDTICLTPGTTTTEIARAIRHRKGILVITNTVNVAMELSQQRNLTVFVTGGFLRGDWFSLTGATAAGSVRQFCPNKLFIGANAADAQQGLTCLNAEEAATNKVMVRQGRYRVAVVDSSKLGRVAPHRFCPSRYIDLLITDTEATDEAVSPFVKKGIEVRRV
jgi:DeoR family transcriptional regulator of aga operon